MELSLRNIGCPACFEILVEPVTTPCNHNVCKICLEKTFENNKFNCIVCRKFLGSWVRSAKSKNRFVNEHLWNNIKQQFGSLVDKRLNDEDYGKYSMCNNVTYFNYVNETLPINN